MTKLWCCTKIDLIDVISHRPLHVSAKQETNVMGKGINTQYNEFLSHWHIIAGCITSSP